jgi:hypothetical protein
MTTEPSQPAVDTCRPATPQDRPTVGGGASGRAGAGDASVGQMVGQVSQDLSVLMRQELELAKAELRQEAGQTGRAAAGLGGAVFAAAMALLFLSCALWGGLAEVIAPGWAALIVAGLWLTAGTPLYLSGRDRLRSLHPVPERTARTRRNVPDALRGR